MAIIAFPILIPFVLIIGLLIFRSDTMARWIGPLGAVLLAVLSVYLFILVTEHGVISLQMGGWEAPFGITLVIDYLSALMLLVSALITFPVSVYALNYLSGEMRLNRFFVFFYGLTMGMNGSFITGDVFNLFVWYEVMLMSSFVLITLGRKKEQLEGGIKYLALNLVGSMFLLAGIGMLYGKTGTLNMAHLALILTNDDQATLMNTSAVLFFVAFGIKSAVFPFISGCLLPIIHPILQLPHCLPDCLLRWGCIPLYGFLPCSLYTIRNSGTSCCLLLLVLQWLQGGWLLRRIMKHAASCHTISSARSGI
jgi:multicomponent Na+:H+ antiporter subunit D